MSVQILTGVSNLDINIFISFFAGITSFLSPCVLPLVPGYLSFMSGLSVVELQSGKLQIVQMRRIITASLAFIFGMAVSLVTVFSIINVLLNYVFDQYRSEINIVLGIIVIVFGLQIAGLLRIGLLLREKRILPKADKIRGPIGAFTMGLAFAFGWTPCIGPVLQGIIALASMEDNAISGMFLMIIYVLGLGLPFLVASLVTNRFLTFSIRLRKHFRYVEISSGGLLVLVGILIMGGHLTEIASLIGRFWSY